MSLEKIGKFLILFFVGFLPWSVIISVAGTEKLGIELMRFSKEILLWTIIIIGICDMWRKKIRPSFSLIDAVIVLYILSLIITSIGRGIPLAGFVYGLRYDAEFLIAFVFFRQLTRFWSNRFHEVARVFILSGAIMIACSLLIRYVFWEVFLTIFGFSGQVSVWDGSGAPPIYHGIPGASVVRFQGLLEGPNQMAFFLLVYMGTFISLFSKYRQYRFINTVILLGLFFLMTQTYSRSGLLGLWLGTCVMIFFLIRDKIRRGHFHIRHANWKKITAFTLAFSVGIALIMLQFWPKFHEVIKRSGSTSAHFERMFIWYKRFLEEPFGHGLAQAGPASRAIVQVNSSPIPPEKLDPEMIRLSKIFLEQNPAFVFTTEHYYIPESWYIQQLIEGWVIGFFFFVMVFVLLLINLRKYPAIFAALAGVLVMNTFLHSFESVHTALVLFLIIASLHKS